MVNKKIGDFFDRSRIHKTLRTPATLCATTCFDFLGVSPCSLDRKTVETCCRPGPGNVLTIPVDNMFMIHSELTTLGKPRGCL